MVGRPGNPKETGKREAAEQIHGKLQYSTLEYGDYMALNQSLGQSTRWIETNPN